MWPTKSDPPYLFTIHLIQIVEVLVQKCLYTLYIYTKFNRENAPPEADMVQYTRETTYRSVESVGTLHDFACYRSNAQLAL